MTWTIPSWCSRTASGDAAPIRVIKGPRSATQKPHRRFPGCTHHQDGGGEHGQPSGRGFRARRKETRPPLRTIRSAPEGQPALDIGNPGAVGYDTMRDQILVPN